MIPATLERGLNEAQASTPRRTIPFDHSLLFDLDGKLNAFHKFDVTVSIEAAFVAVSIGYGVIPTVPPIKFAAPPLTPLPPSTATPSTLSTIFPAIDFLAKALGEGGQFGRGQIGPNTAGVLSNGVRLNPDIAERVLLASPISTLAPDILENLFQAVAAPPDQVQFLYAIYDVGTGRAFQDRPILNIAGLGIANGDRPFRYFAQPITFAPRSTIRMEVTEKSEFSGKLHVVLHGYKVLGGAGTPTGSLRRRARRMRRR